MTGTTKSATSTVSSLLWNFAFLALGVLTSVAVTLNTINNTDGLVLVLIVTVASLCGTILSTIAIAIAGEGKFRRYATRALLFCMATLCTIIASGLAGQY